MTARTISGRFLLTPPQWGGLVLSCGAAALLLTRYGASGKLSRDESVYAYAGQQVAHGVPPFVSIFDPKGPGAGFVAGGAAFVADLAGRNDLLAIRVLFLLLSCATVVAVYLLALRLFGSVLGGLTAAVVMASFKGWAVDALAGPDAKVPGIFLVVVAMLLMTHRRWAWAAFVGGLAFLVWQPLFVYPTLAVLLAALGTTGRRRMTAALTAAAAAAAPVLLVLGYYAVTGALGRLVEAALVFPFAGLQHGSETFAGRVGFILTTLQDFYGQGPVAVTFWLGWLALLVLVGSRVRGAAPPRTVLRDPLVCVVAVSGLAEAAYALTDFQGYPDVYPLLPYAALGLGGAVAAVLARSPSPAWRVPLGAVTWLVLLALTVGSALQFVHDRTGNDHELRAQLSSACGLERMLGRHGTLWALGDPAPLVLTHRTNPDRFVYLASGVDRWKLDHLPGGFDSWTRRLATVHPAVLVMHDWSSPVRDGLSYWLLHEGGYRRARLGQWLVFVDHRAKVRAHRLGVHLTVRPTDGAVDRAGRPLPSYRCRLLRHAAA